MPTKKQRVLLARALFWNVLSGNVSTPSVMRIPLVTNTVKLPLVPGEIPRSRKAIPLEYDLLEFLFGVIVAPVVLPALMLRSVGKAVGEQARYESGEITEEDYRKRKEGLTPRLEELEK